MHAVHAGTCSAMCGMACSFADLGCHRLINQHRHVHATQKLPPRPSRPPANRWIVTARLPAMQVCATCAPGREWAKCKDPLSALVQLCDGEWRWHPR